MSTVERFRIGNLDADGALRAGVSLGALERASAYEIDFTDMKWVEPFGMLLFSSQFRRFKSSHSEARFRAEGFQSHGYAAHMGFFQAFGLGYGSHPGDIQGDLRYIPITPLNISDLEHEASQKAEDVRDTLELHSELLARVLTRGAEGDLHDTLKYSLREILRNVVEHSRAETIWYAAQYWPEKELVELAILDEGIGIRSSLSRNPHLEIRSDADAASLALLPGVSGVSYKGGPRQRRDPWANSGYGLFMTSQLCARGGSFLLCSGSVCRSLSGTNTNLIDADFAGTALRLRIATQEVRNLSETLDQFRQRGAEIAGELRVSANVTASMSARMLKRDFGD